MGAIARLACPPNSFNLESRWPIVAMRQILPQGIGYLRDSTAVLRVRMQPLQQGNWSKLPLVFDPDEIPQADLFAPGRCEQVH